MIVDVNSVDLTGTNPDFKREDLRFMVFRGNQIIYFHEPIYATGLVVYAVTTSGIDTAHPLVAGVDYIIPTGNSELVADDAIAEAKLYRYREGGSFNQNLIKGIQITRGFTSEYQISVFGQAYYRQISDYIGTGDGPDYSPALMASVIERIRHLELIKNPMNSIITTDIEQIRPLEEDLTAALPANFIQNEQHEINTANNKYAIRPIYGTFYDTSDLKVFSLTKEHRAVTADDIGSRIYDPTLQVQITLTAQNINEYIGWVLYIEKLKELARYNEATNSGYYVVRGVDQIRTRISHTSFGVYDRILIVKPLAGTVEIQYHAFGGEVSLKDIYALKHGLISLYENIGDGGFITDDALAAHPSIVGLESRMSNVEDILHWVKLSEFRYTYAFDAVTPSGLETRNVPRDRWVNVATLFKDSWTSISGPPMKHAEEFCLESQSQHYCVYFTLKYDLNTNKLFIDNVRGAANSVACCGYDYFDKRRTPKFRVIYLANNLTKGIVLQMSIISPEEGYNPWQLRVVNTASASWDCIRGDGQELPEASTSTILPDGATVWNNGAKTNHVVLSNPYTVYVGNIPMSAIDAESYREGNISTGTDQSASYQDEPGKVELEGFYIRTIQEENAFTINDIKGFRFHVYDRYIGKMIVKDTDSVSLASDTSINGETIYYPVDLCSIGCVLTNITPGTFKIAIKSYTGLHSLTNERFDFRQLDILFNEREA